MKKVLNTLLTLAVMISGLCFTSCEEKEPEGQLVVTASTNIIVADGNDEVVLTAKFGELDVTQEVFFYANNTPMSSNVFTTVKAGDYKFFASYKGNLSNQVTVKAASPALYIAIPEDSQPEKFSSFSRKVLVAEATGTWCGYCPYMIKGLEYFSESGSNAEKAVIVAAHSGDELSSKASEAAIAALNINEFPSCALNLNPESLVESYSSPSMNAENINTAVGMELKESVRVGIAAATAVSADKSTIGVRAAVKVGKEGSYRINAWLIEDGVAASQSSYWYEFSNGKSAIVIDHMHILRGASSVSPIQGQLLGEKESCAAGDVIDFYYEFDTKEHKIANVKNCKVAVLVTAGSGSASKFFVNNIVECAVGEAVPFAYN
ncbi:MAG: Omp28-related outer membrane protein [Bacteroidaceae bacterium]|nr:Omp28-related outer membrane protein [Bacteroidaceae bacterium]